MASKRSTKPPAATPERRNTIEVEASWLIRTDPPPGARKKEPPPLPAGPKRHDTIEVQMDWLEEPLEDSAKPTAPKPRGKLPPPIPREEPASEPKSSVATKSPPGMARTKASPAGKSQPAPRRRRPK